MLMLKGSLILFCLYIKAVYIFLRAVLRLPKGIITTKAICIYVYISFQSLLAAMKAALKVYRYPLAACRAAIKA
jgi:hypothetical protein